MNKLRFILIAVLALQVLYWPTSASAGTLTARKLTLGSSAPGNVNTTWAFTFTTASETGLRSMKFQVCTTPSGTCSVPTGWANTGATISSITYNGSAQTLDASNWTISLATAGELRLTNANATPTTSASPVVVTFANVDNPTNANEAFYVRITTYTDAAYTTTHDGPNTVASSTANQITLTGTVDESLTFCVGVTVTSNCSSTTGTAASWSASSTFSSATARTATSQFAAATNAQSGYAVTVSGNTLTCDSTSTPSCSPTQTISALATQTASSAGSEQFGLNLRANTSPASFGTDKSGGSATVNANYNTVNQYRFVAGDTLASHTGTSDFTVFTAAYIANISALTEAGQYKTTLTFVCTPTF